MDAEDAAEAEAEVGGEDAIPAEETMTVQMTATETSQGAAVDRTLAETTQTPAEVRPRDQRGTSGASLSGTLGTARTTTLPVGSGSS